MRRRPFRKVRLLRRLLLALLALTVLGVIALFWLGRIARPPTRPGGGGDAEMGGDRVTYEARGFDHTVSIGDRPLFRVRSERTATGPQGRQPKLQEVDLTYFREDGSEYGITASFGSYDLETQAARLRGDVVLRGPTGFTLRTDRLRLAPRSEWLASAPGVTFQINERLSGRAHRLRANLDSNVFLLDGPVQISGTSEEGEQLALDAGQVLYERDQNLIRAEGEPLLRYADSQLEAQRMSVELDAAEGEVRYLTAHWGVAGQIRSDQTSVIDVAAHELHGEFGPQSGELERLELLGTEGQPAQLDERRGRAFHRLLSGQRIEGSFVEDSGRLQELHASGDVHLAETLRGRGGTSTRDARADLLSARVAADGTLANAELRRRVTFRQDGQRVTGDRAVYAAAGNTIVVTGNPARATEEGRELAGPALRYQLDDGIVRGDQGVQAIFQPQEDVELPAAKRPASRPPIQIDAESLEADTRNRSFVFTGRVRAWQGASYLLADRLAGREQGQLLEADGPVKTVWEAVPEVGDAEPATPTEITGSRLLYSRAARHLTYFGPAAIRQGPRRVQCGRVEAQLDENDEARRMVCSGNVRIDDAESGRRVSNGDQAIYDTTTEEVVVTGRPVQLRERDGATVEGPKVIYRLDDGTALVVRDKSAAATAPEGAGDG